MFFFVLYIYGRGSPSPRVIYPLRADFDDAIFSVSPHRCVLLKLYNTRTEISFRTSARVIFVFLYHRCVYFFYLLLFCAHSRRVSEFPARRGSIGLYTQACVCMHIYNESLKSERVSLLRPYFPTQIQKQALSLSRLRVYE